MGNLIRYFPRRADGWLDITCAAGVQSRSHLRGAGMVRTILFMEEATKSSGTKLRYYNNKDTTYCRVCDRDVGPPGDSPLKGAFPGTRVNFPTQKTSVATTREKSSNFPPCFHGLTPVYLKGSEATL